MIESRRFWCDYYLDIIKKNASLKYLSVRLLTLSGTDGGNRTHACWNHNPMC